MEFYEGPLPAGIMPDPYLQVPEELRLLKGSWVRHEEVSPGILRHQAWDGTELYTVRIRLPAGGLVSADTLRTLAYLIRAYAMTGRRTSRQAFELVGVKPDKLALLLADLAEKGFYPGGTGNSLRQVKCCTSFFHCENAVLNALSLAEKITLEVLERFGENLPAPLRISISGCPNQCGGGPEADIGITGYYSLPPEVDERALAEANIDTKLLAAWCPARAISRKKTPWGMAVTIRQDKCIRCGSCLQVAPEGIKPSGVPMALVAVGGTGKMKHSGKSAKGMCFHLEGRPPESEKVVDLVISLIQDWYLHAKAGETLRRYYNRTAKLGPKRR